MDRLLSQEEIDRVFRGLKANELPEDLAKSVQPYDFRRPDRIGKDQLRALHLLHENFARNLAASLSAYLRAYVMVNLVSVEQLSFAEFTQCLPSPSCLVSLAMKPFDGNAVLELNPSLVFPVLEMLLGGTGKGASKISREITEIEQTILDGLYRIILHDLKLTWHPVTDIDFAIESRETEPQLMHIMAPNEALLAIGMEIRMAESAGLMNLGMPSIIVKMLRQKFDLQWAIRRGEPRPEEQARILRLVKPALMECDARLEGPTIEVEDLMRIEAGDVLKLDCPVDSPVNLLVNGRLKFRGQIASTGRKRALVIEELYQPAG